MDKTSPRTLIVGAGAVGSLLTARLIEKGADVTLLTRPQRFEQITLRGLHVSSHFGRFRNIAPVIVGAQLRERYDLVVLTCRAHLLADAMALALPAVDRNTVVLSLVDGGPFSATLAQSFPNARILEGIFEARAKMDADAVVSHYGPAGQLTIGARMPGDGIARFLADFLAGRGIDTAVAHDIAPRAWARTVYLAAGSGTSVMSGLHWRDALRTAAGSSLANAFLESGVRIARLHGVSVPSKAVKRYMKASSLDGEPVLPPPRVEDPRGTGQEAIHFLALMTDRGNTGPLTRDFQLALNKMAQGLARI